MALRKGFSSDRDPYLSYYSRNSAGVIGESIVDDRLPTKAMGIGLVIDELPAYYPVTLLKGDRFVNDTIAGQPLLVAYHPSALTDLVFSRELDGQTLTFEAGYLEIDLPILVDAETGSRWSSFDGVAISGPLAGEALDRIPSTTSFWFGWTDWHPDTYLYGEERLQNPG